MLTTRRLLAGTMLVLGSLRAQAASGMDCGRAVVNAGDSEKQVKARCGTPDFVYGYSGVYRRGRYIPVDEDWYYDRGSDRLLRRLRFHDGTLQEADMPGYGAAPAPSRNCTPQDLRTGMTVYDLLSRCGYPKSRRKSIAHERRGAVRDDVVLSREEWLYDFGPDYLLQRVEVDEGEVQEITGITRRKR